MLDKIEKEIGLHEKIMRHCETEFPRWKYIHARTDQRSTIAVGVADFTIFLPGGKVVCLEVKSATGKLSEAQLAWSKEMEMLGHTVHVVRTMEDFYHICHTQTQE
jgi:hypothetical protein